MKILFVNHTFPPHSYAGSELCVLNLSHELKRLGHEPVVFFRYSNTGDDELYVQEGQVDGIRYYKINNTFRYISKFQDIYLNQALAAKFSVILHTVQPDLVHFHHVTNLSLSLVKEVKEYGCPMVMTLHDYWLLCQRGQLLKPDMSLCDGPSHSSCRSCLAVPLLKGNAQRLAQRLWKSAKPQHRGNSTISLTEKKPKKIDTPTASFFAKSVFEINGESHYTLQAHPPLSITYSLPLDDEAVLKTAMAMHPSTYNQPGSGVIFTVFINGEQKIEHTINAKQNEEQRAWYPVEIPLSPHRDGHCEITDGYCEITFQTQSQDPNDNQHCTAGWKDPVIIPNMNATKNTKSPFSFKPMLHAAAYWAAGFVAACSSTANEGIRHRRNWVQRVFDDVDLFISPSQFLRDFFIHHGLPKDKIIFSDNGFILPGTKNTNKPQHPLRFGYIGTWIPSKGVDIALQAFQGIDPQKAKFIVHGFFPGYDGYENYEDELKSHAGEAVEFRGKYDPQEVYTLLQELDCLIMPSIWWENSPMTIHEAFAAGVPVITADTGGMAEQVQNGGGFTFKHRNAESLRVVLDDIIQNPGMLSDRKKSIPAVKSIESFANEILGIYTHCITHHDKRTTNHRI